MHTYIHTHTHTHTHTHIYIYIYIYIYIFLCTSISHMRATLLVTFTKITCHLITGKKAIK